LGKFYLLHQLKFIEINDIVAKVSIVSFSCIGASGAVGCISLLLSNPKQLTMISVTFAVYSAFLKLGVTAIILEKKESRKK